MSDLTAPQWHRFKDGKWAVKGPASLITRGEHLEVPGRSNPRVYITKTSKTWEHQGVRFCFGFVGSPPEQYFDDLPMDMPLYHPPAWYRQKAAEAREAGDEAMAKRWEAVLANTGFGQ